MNARIFIFFFFNDTATTEIYTLSLHDALPICFTLSCRSSEWQPLHSRGSFLRSRKKVSWFLDRKSTRLNSSHANISYAVFCLKKKNQDDAEEPGGPGITSRARLSRHLEDRHQG